MRSNGKKHTKNDVFSQKPTNILIYDEYISKNRRTERKDYANPVGTGVAGRSAWNNTHQALYRRTERRDHNPTTVEWGLAPAVYRTKRSRSSLPLWGRCHGLSVTDEDTTSSTAEAVPLPQRGRSQNAAKNRKSA